MKVTGSALYKIQSGRPKLTAYVSKRLPEAAWDYAITELKMCGFAINIIRFCTSIEKSRFDAINRSFSFDTCK